MRFALCPAAAHVNRTLQSLVERGMVEHKTGRVFMHDSKGMAAHVDFDPSYLHLRI